jgi:Protein of unknown function (DUF1806).
LIPIDAEAVQARLEALKGRDLYLHLESTTGAYASHHDSSRHPSSAFVKNAVIRYERGSIAGSGPYRVGLKMAHGWVYCEGLTHYEESETERLLLAGHNAEGKLAVALQLSPQPF